MNQKSVDGLWLAAVMATCALSFSPALAALPEDPSPLQRSAAPDPEQPTQANYDFVDVNAVDAIKALAKDMRRNVYIGPGVEGVVTLKLQSVTPTVALDTVLQSLPGNISYRLVGYNTLIVATPDRVDTIEGDIMGRSMSSPRKANGNIRQEVLLEHVPAQKVIEFLSAHYQDLEFIPHPTMNGFYVVGERRQVLMVKQDIPALDRKP